MSVKAKMIRNYVSSKSMAVTLILVITALVVFNTSTLQAKTTPIASYYTSRGRKHYHKKSIDNYIITIQNICIPNRHIHLSSESDASTTMIVSFSSHQCDVMRTKMSGKLSRSNNYQQEHHDHYGYSPSSLYSGVIVSKYRHHIQQYNLFNRKSSKHVEEEEEGEGDKQHNENSKSNHEFLDYILYFPQYKENIEKDGAHYYNTNYTIKRYNTTMYRGQKKIEYWSEYQHHVVLSGLEPNTRYYYQCIIELGNLDDTAKEQQSLSINYNEDEKAILSYNNNGYEDNDDDNTIDYKDYSRKTKRINNTKTSYAKESIFTFKTAPQSNHKTYKSTTKMAVFGDLGVFDHSKETLLHLVSRKDDFDFMILAGDISYANSNHVIWDRLFTMFDNIELFRTKVSVTAVIVITLVSDFEEQELRLRFLSFYLAIIYSSGQS